MTVPHIKAAIDNSEDAADRFAQLIEHLVAGRLPAIPELLDSRALPLEKGESTRPLSVGEFILRTGQQCALAEHPNAGIQMAPHQLGEGVRSGSQAVGLAVLAALEKDRNVVLVASDIANAFGSISKRKIFAATKEREPARLPLTQCTYNQPNKMWFDDAPPHAPPVLAHTDTLQGLPMGPINFTLPMQSTLNVWRSATQTWHSSASWTIATR